MKDMVVMSLNANMYLENIFILRERRLRHCLFFLNRDLLCNIYSIEPKTMIHNSSCNKLRTVGEQKHNYCTLF